MSDALRPVRRRVPPPEDPFDLVPAFDPARPDNPPPPPGTQALTTTQPPDEDAPDSVQACRKRLKELAKELLAGPSPGRVKALTQEIVRTRIAASLFNEADSGESDPDTYKDLSMLNRIMAGEDTLDDPTGDEARHAEAEALLEKRGINAEAARRLMRVFESVTAVQETTSDVGSESRRRRPTH